MKQNLESLLKVINEAHIKSDKLRKKLGFRLKNYKLTKEDIFDIEVKLTPEEYEKYKDKDIKLSEIDLVDRQWAYFYDRKDVNLFSAEKVYNNKLKEYYISTIDANSLYTEKSNSLMPQFNASGKFLVEMLDNALNFSNVLTGFTLNGIRFYPNYISVDASSNKADEVYFYSSEDSGYTRFFVNQLNSYEIIRVNLRTFKIDQIYSETIQNKKLTFKYYKPSNLEQPYTILQSISID